MPSVIRLRKSELIDFAQILVLSNTPLSLFNGMVRCAGMEKLRKCPIADLTAYYDSITARAERSEIAAGLAYAVLCAIILHAREAPQIYVDASRLQWGERIWDFMKHANVGTSRVVLKPLPPPPSISSLSSLSADTPVLYGAHGEVLRRRDH